MKTTPILIIKRNSRLTLIEMVMVIAIIAVIMSIAVVGVRIAFGRQADWQSRATFKQLALGFEMYYNDNRCYPFIPAENAINKGDSDANKATNPYYITLGTAVSYLYTTTISTSTVTTASFLRATLNRLPANRVSYLQTQDVSGLETDGFGNPIYYRYPGLHNPQSYDLWSAGADSQQYMDATTHLVPTGTGANAVNNDNYNNWQKY